MSSVTHVQNFYSYFDVLRKMFQGSLRKSKIPVAQKFHSKYT